jgi:hypothetical protein
MTEAERRDPEPSALIERLLRRYTEPIGIIDVRHAQAHHARIAGWIEARFPLLIELAARHGLSGEGEAGAAEFIYAGRALPHPGEQPVWVPGGAPVFAQQASRGGGTLEKSPLTPLGQRGEGENSQRAKGDSQTGNRKTLRAAAEAHPATSVEPPPSPAAERLEVSRLRRGRLRGGSVLPLAKGEDEKTTNDGQGLPPSASLGESEDEAVPSSPALPVVKSAKTVWRVPRAAPEPTTVLSPELTHSPGQALDFPRFPPTKPIGARIRRKHSDVSFPLTKRETQGGAEETSTTLDSLSVSSLVRERVNKLSLPPMDPDRKGPDRKGSVQNALLPRYFSAMITAPAGRLPKGIEPSLDPRTRNVVQNDSNDPFSDDSDLLTPTLSRRERELKKMPRPETGTSPETETIGGDRNFKRLWLALAPKDVRAVPLVWRRTSTTDPDRTMEAGDAREQRRMFPPGTSQQPSFGKLSRSDITEHRPVSQTIVPIPERPRLRLSKREWAELIERLSRLICHKLAVDLDRRGIRAWRS